MGDGPEQPHLLVVDGAGHYEMYDEPEYVDQAVGQLAAFSTEHLLAEP